MLLLLNYFKFLLYCFIILYNYITFITRAFFFSIINANHTLVAQEKKATTAGFVLPTFKPTPGYMAETLPLCHPLRMNYSWIKTSFTLSQLDWNHWLIDDYWGLKWFAKQTNQLFATFLKKEPFLSSVKSFGYKWS